MRGTSVATAARRHNVNPNQVSTTTKEPSIVPREIATIAFSSSGLAESEALSSCQGFDADDREAVVGHAAAVAPRGGTLTRGSSWFADVGVASNTGRVAPESMPIHRDVGIINRPIRPSAGTRGARPLA